MALKNIQKNGMSAQEQLQQMADRVLAPKREPLTASQRLQVMATGVEQQKQRRAYEEERRQQEEYLNSPQYQAAQRLSYSLPAEAQAAAGRQESPMTGTELREVAANQEQIRKDLNTLDLYANRGLTGTERLEKQEELARAAHEAAALEEQRRTAGLTGTERLAPIRELEQKKKALESELAHAQEMVKTYGDLHGSHQTSAEEKARALEQRTRFEAESERISRELAETEQSIRALTIEGYSSMRYAPDFRSFSAEGAKMRRPRESSAGDPELDAYLEEIGSRADAANKGTFVDQAENIDIMQFLTNEENDIYNYLLAKYGQDSADAYIASMTDELNRRKGGNIANVLARQDGLAEFVQTANFAFRSGFDKYGSGMRQLGNEDALTASPVRYASQAVRENLADVGPKILGSSLGQMGYDLLETTGNMAPSILLSTVTGVPILGTASMGVSAGGNAYTEALNMGYSKEQARDYAILVGASEAALQYVLGGIKSLGGKGGVSAKLASKINQIDNGLARFALTVGRNGLSEGMEEGLQAILEPIFRNIVTGEDVDIDIAQVVYEALLGGFSGILLGGGNVNTDTGASPDASANDIPTQAAAEAENLAQEGVEPSEVSAPTPQEKSEPAAKNKAEGYGEYGANALHKVMEDYGLDEGAAEAMFRSAYEVGRTEVTREKVTFDNPIQEAAYIAGRQDAIMSKSTLESGVNPEYTGINKTTETESLNNGAEEIHLRDSSKRTGSENTGRQIPGMEEGTGRNQSRQAEGRPADGETAALTYGRKVSTASLGIAGGSRKNTIRLVTGGDTTATRAARQIAKERGLRVVFFSGNNMEITQADGSVVSARAFITGDRVFIRVDHADYTSDQLMRHEAGHDMIAKGEINPDTVRKRISQTFGKEKAGQLADMYVDAYEGSGMTAEAVWEEVICDSLGDMNIFSGTARESNAWELLKETKAASTDTRTESTRGPPAEGKASREVNGGKDNGNERTADSSAARTPDAKRRISNRGENRGIGGNVESDYRNLTRKERGRIRKAVLSALLTNEYEARGLIAGFDAEHIARSVYEKIVVNGEVLYAAEELFPGLHAAVFAAADMNNQHTYEVNEKTGKAAWTKEHINWLFREYGMGDKKWHQQYAQAYAARMSPDDFLSLTATDRIKGGIELEAVRKYGELDIEKLEEDRTSPMLVVDMETGAVEGHEGRHRMVLLNNEGIDNVPVVIVPYNQGDKYNRTKIGSISLSGQRWTDGAAPGKVEIRDVTPFSTEYRSEVESAFGGEAEIKFSRELDIQTSINQSMTMQQAKQMIQRAFVLGDIKNWFDGEYKNGDEWLRGEGASDVAMIIDNEYSLQAAYLDKIQGVLDGDFYTEDILEAYLAGTLTGKQKPKTVKLDVSASVAVADNRFYAPKQIENAKALYETANQRINKNNQKAVIEARAKILLYAHNKGAAETLGITEAELNKKLRTWSNYSAKAKNISARINSGVAEGNRWTGIENMSYVNQATVTTEEIKRMVKSVEGDGDGYENRYLARTMLALDTHIDWSWLDIIFDTYAGVNASSSGNKCNGYYLDSKRRVHVMHNAPNTVAHEMGHALDYQWARDLGLHGALTESYRNTQAVSGDVKVWLDHFKDFTDALVEASDIRSAYTGNIKETFARFVAKFVEWTEEVGTGRSSGYERSFYNDKFTGSQFVQFARLLQEKAMIDAKGLTNNAINQTKYSRDLESIKQMQKENAEMKEANREIERLYNSGRLAKMDKATLTGIARDIIKGISSKANVAEVTEQLRELHEYLIAGEDGDKGSWNTAYGMAYEIAAEILENVSEIDDSMYREYAELRDTIRNTGISISKEYNGDMQGYESLNDFRKANFGRIKLVNNGLPVDIFYRALAYSYPGFFDEAEHSHPADQLQHISEVLDDLRPFEVNPFSSNMTEATTWLAEDIMMRFYRVQNEKLAAAVQRGKDKALNARRREIAKREEKIKKLKQKQKAKEAKMSQNRQAAILRAKIQRHIGPMKQKLLRPSDKQHVPQELREAVASMLDAINLESSFDYKPGSQYQTSRGATVGKHTEKGSGDPTKRTEEFLKVREMYQKIINEGKADDMVIDPALIGSEDNRSMLNEVIAMRDIPIASMNAEQLQTIWDCVRAIAHSISKAGENFTKSKFATTKAFADAFAKDTATRKAINRDKNADKRAKDLETPYTFFSRYGEAGMEFYRALRNAQDAEQIMQDELVERVGEVVSSEQKKKLEKDAEEFTTVSGDKLTLSKAHVMEIYLLNKREQARGHLTSGGIVQPEAGKAKRGAEPVLLTEEDVANIIGSLTEEEQKIADDLQKLTLWLAEKGNEASLKVYGYEKFGDPNYWTIRSANEQIAQTVEKNRDNPRSIANMGSAKPLTPNASNALDIFGVFDTFSRHASDMLTYSAWLAAMEDANRLFNFKFKDADGNITGKNMQTLLNKVGGAASTNYWLELMKDIQNGIQNPADTGIEGVAKKIVANTKKASVAANIRVVIQQPTAIGRAAVVLNPVHLAAAIGKDAALKPAVDGWRKAMKYAPIASRKAAGGYEVSSNPKQLADLLYKPESKKGKALKGLKEAPLWAAGEADKFTWGTIWNACEMQISAQNKGLEGDALHKKVAELFTEVIDQTQVVDGVLQRSQAMRSGSALMQQMTAFTGEPTMAANMVIRAYDNVRREGAPKKRSAGFKTLGRAVGAYAVTAGLNAFAQSLIDAMRDDEDDEEFWQKVKKHMWGITGKEEKWWDRIRNVLLAGNAVNNINPLNWIPILKDVMSILQGYSVERMDAASMSDFFSDIALAVKSLGGEGKYTTGYAFMKVMASGGKLLGLSAANFIRDVESIIDTIHFASDDVEAMYEAELLVTRIPNNKKGYLDLAYLAYSKGDMDTYDRIVSDMIDAGVDASYIESGMRSRTKGAGIVDAGVGIKAAYEKSSEESEAYGANNLTGSQYTELMDQRGEIYADVAAELNLEGLDNETATALLRAAYEYAEKTALLEVTGGSIVSKKVGDEMETYIVIDEQEYEIDYPAWIIAAQEGDLGISPAEYIMYKEEYGASALASKGVQGAADKGIDLNLFLDINDFAGDQTADKDAKGKSIPGSKKEKITDYMETKPISDREFDIILELLGYKPE